MTSSESAAVARLAPWRVSLDFAVACAVVALVACVDQATGAEFDTSLAYVFAVGWITWRASAAAGVAFCVIGAITDTFMDVSLGRFQARFVPIAWNLLIQTGLLLLGVRAVASIRANMASERRMAARVRELHGLLDEEMRQVGDIQRSLLPPAPPAIPGVELAVHYATATRAGGDYYDFLARDDGHVVLAVADVSGHGAAAAVIMAMTRALVHREVGAHGEPERLLAAVNDGLVRNIPERQFVTACAVELAPGAGAVTFALAGHPQPMLLRAGDHRVGDAGVPQGPPLGVLTDVAYDRQRVELAPGDALVLFTDGLTEARRGDGPLLGEDEVARCLRETDGAGAGAIVARLVERVRAHVGADATPEDDVTIVVVRRAA